MSDKPANRCTREELHGRLLNDEELMNAVDALILAAVGKITTATAKPVEDKDDGGEVPADYKLQADQMLVNFRYLLGVIDRLHILMCDDPFVTWQDRANQVEAAVKKAREALRGVDEMVILEQAGAAFRAAAALGVYPRRAKDVRCDGPREVGDKPAGGRPG